MRDGELDRHIGPAEAHSDEHVLRAKYAWEERTGHGTEAAKVTDYLGPVVKSAFATRNWGIERSCQHEEGEAAMPTLAEARTGGTGGRRRAADAMLASRTIQHATRCQGHRANLGLCGRRMQMLNRAANILRALDAPHGGAT